MRALTNSNSNPLAFAAVPAQDGVAERTTLPGSLKSAYVGLYLFTLLLYVRPNELFPEVFGSFPLAKIVAISMVMIYALGKLSKGESLTKWPLELKMVFLIVALGVAFIPLAASPQDSIDVLNDTFSKVVIIFIVMINLIDTRERLLKLLRLMVITGTWIAYDAIIRFKRGEFSLEGIRIQGVVGGMFGGPNDLAISFCILLPLAISLIFVSKGLMRIVFLACSVLLGAGVVVTFSRGGFLGMVVLGGVLMWKLGRRHRGLTVAAGALVLFLFVFAMPGGYSSRITSISDENLDKTGSSWERSELLKRAFNVALHHPLTGVGMGNFHIFSIKEKVAHNSYLEIWVELGLIGLGAYLVLIFAPLRSLQRIENESFNDKEQAGAGEHVKKEFYFLSVGLQSSLAAYIVTSFFGSIQYLWHIYYLAGFGVAITAMWAAEKASLSQVKSLVPVNGLNQKSHREKKVKGVLWKPNRLRGAFR